MAWTGLWPHVDGASPGVVEGRPRGAAHALIGSQCSGAVGAGAAALTTVATAASAGGSRRSRIAEWSRGGRGPTLLGRGG
jgi:hypothetical protein